MSILRLKLNALYKAISTTRLKHAKRSDAIRWSQPTSLHASWDSRTAILASFVAPGSSVLEFGAGRMVLPIYLPQGCTYTPSDIVDRGQGTIVCDLNATQLPVFPYHDVIFFSGVLEYIHDPDRLIAHLTHCCHTIVTSYAVSDIPGQGYVWRRRRHGWVNDYSLQGLKELFDRHGLHCEKTSIWNTQYLFKFVRTP